MKKTFLLTALFMLCAFVFYSHAQEDTFEKDIMRMLELNGSTQTYDMVFDQMVMQMQSSMPNVSDSVWTVVKADVFDEQVKALKKKLVPVYKKHFTHEDVKAVIKFYQTDAGKKLAEKTPVISQESMAIGQQWGMGLNMAIQEYMKEHGYVENKQLGQ